MQAKCPHCQITLDLSGCDAGVTITCGACKGTLVVPQMAPVAKPINVASHQSALNEPQQQASNATGQASPNVNNETIPEMFINTSEEKGLARKGRRNKKVKTVPLKIKLYVAGAVVCCLLFAMDEFSGDGARRRAADKASRELTEESKRDNELWKKAREDSIQGRWRDSVFGQMTMYKDGTDDYRLEFGDGSSLRLTKQSGKYVMNSNPDDYFMIGGSGDLEAWDKDGWAWTAKEVR